jgi:hypothetical protein
MPAPLGQLLSDSWAFCKMYWKPILISAAVFGTVASIIAATLAGTAAWKAGGMMDEMGIDLNRMEDLGQRMQAGDEAALGEMEAMFQDRFGDMTEEQTGQMAFSLTMQMLRSMAPVLGLSALLMMILSVFSYAYYLKLSLSPTQDTMAPVKPAFSLFFPLLGVWIWSFLRSFAWIPIIGIIPAIILGPRFALASVILVQEKKGVMESVSLSYARTSGYWAKIIGNMIVAVLCIALAMIVVDIVAGIIGFIIPMAGFWLKPVAKYITMAFMAVFMTKLSLTVMGKSATAVSTPAPSRIAKPAPAATKKAAPKKSTRK